MNISIDKMKIKKTGILITVLSVMLLSFPVRSFLAESYYKASVSNLASLKGLDPSGVVSKIKESIDLIGKSVFLFERARYHKVLSDYYSVLAKREEIQSLFVETGEGRDSLFRESYVTALHHLKRAVDMEPTNYDLHVGLSSIYYSIGKDTLEVEEELKKARTLYPSSPNLRSLVAREFFLKGYSGDALEQARMLAASDRSYVDSYNPYGYLLKESNPREYELRLSGSHLFNALDVSWNITGDIEVLRGITPDSEEAQDVLNLYLDWRGIE